MARTGAFTSAGIHPFGLGVNLDVLYSTNSSSGNVVSTPGPPAPPQTPAPGTIPPVVRVPVTSAPTPISSNPQPPIGWIGDPETYRPPKVKPSIPAPIKKPTVNNFPSTRTPGATSLLNRIGR